MKTIIAATDYSNAGTNALNYAAALARELNAKLIIYNAFQIPVHVANSLLPASCISGLSDENREKLHALAAGISKLYGIAVEPVCSISYVVEEVMALVEKLQADLVVVGMSEKDPDFGYSGCVTSYIVEQTAFPVLIVPEEVGYNGIGKILFACNYQYLKPANKLPVLKEFANAYKAKVEVLHVNKEDDTVEVAEDRVLKKVSALENMLQGIDHLYRDISDEHVLTGIEREVEEYKADLLVMVPHHTGFWNSVFNRSRTRKMAMKTPVPLLVIPNPT